MYLITTNTLDYHVDRWRAEGRGIAFAETRNYVRRVEELKEIYRKAYRRQLGA